MKIPDIRKTLKNSLAKVRINRQYGVFSAVLSIVDPTRDWDRHLVHLEAQANDLRVPDVRPEENVKSFRSFPDVGAFYAVKIRTISRLDGYESGSEDPALAANFFKLIRGVIENKNLRYVYPSCELAQVIAALEELGCELDEVIVEGKEFATWRRERLGEKQEVSEVAP